MSSPSQNPALTTPVVAPLPAEVPGDMRMARRLWSFLLASAVSLIPFTVFGMYLVPIAAAADGNVAEIGGLRGLGGLAALTGIFAHGFLRNQRWSAL